MKNETTQDQADRINSEAVALMGEAQYLRERGAWGKAAALDAKALPLFAQAKDLRDAMAARGHVETCKICHAAHAAPTPECDDKRAGM